VTASDTIDVFASIVPSDVEGDPGTMTGTVGGPPPG
jgi:hypothetical protein